MGLTAAESFLKSILDLMKNISEASLFSFARKTPSTIVSGTNPVTGNFSSFQVIDPTTKIASYTLDGNVVTTFSGITLAQGLVIYGKITSITLSAGSGIAQGGY